MLTGLSLTAQPGHITALLGPNGAGKSTTVEAAVGIHRPEAGNVNVLGVNPATGWKRLSEVVGWMPQEGGVHLSLKPLEALRHRAALYANPRSVNELADDIGIRGSWTSSTLKRISGGELQRVRLALALVGRPTVVFLDEPTNGLDAQSRIAVWDAIAHLREDNVAIVLSTHVLADAERLADHVVIIDAGHTVVAGTPQELTGSGAPHIAFTATPRLDVSSLVAALPEGVGVAEDSPGEYRVDGRTDPQVMAAVTAWCAQHNIVASSLRVARRTLEDVYLDLTGRSLR